MKRLMFCFAALAIVGTACLTGCGTTAQPPTITDIQSAATLINDALLQAQQVAATAQTTVDTWHQTQAVFQQLGSTPADTVVTESEAACGPDGCADVPARHATVITNVMPAERAAAVICGLTAVDPRKYGGWKGDCPGCDVDAQSWAIACQSEGVPYELLLNSRATHKGIIASATRACSTLSKGDLLILYISGHGGQQADAEGDEPDQLDETLCLWDGQLSDDVVWQLLCQVPTGVRVWMVTDTCNSGTNYRAPHSYRSLLQSGGPTLLHWGGCADGKSSFGSAQGGTFTTALVDSYKQGQSYDAWFKDAKRRMPPSQRPTCESVGPDFKTLPAFR